ncbi:DNA/RNA non-specific endonuclease [Planobispora longispora]|uniref:Serine protease n=1 Tax=Planobispora longispora TaxID=28887 RepID=A0A8J3RNX9_9ACTN|nr:DNA/RNA non-specific endonuclease [Planobispora longispora]BFE84431.1 DNA/RNA non-specific endonuclease [Planobispora longispora]GIH75688.1 endonuclease [Planobispora longispora]
METIELLCERQSLLHERQTEAATRRVAERAPERHGHEAALTSPGGLARADSPERISKRIDRLSRFYGDDDLLERDAPEPEAQLEKIINTADFVGVRYLDAGVLAARGVGRVNIRDDRGRLIGYGTGSLVSPALLLTNHHVLTDAGAARNSVIEFNYQDGIDGRPLHAVMYPLDPDRFFLADAERDFALVAVRAPAADLAALGFNRMIESEGKAIIGEFVTIVQHPRGEKKQVALRENRIVDVLDQFLHYVADTEPGSSGSPVFNDQWEVVALHHAAVPVGGDGDDGGFGRFVNEGIRISRICRFVREASLPPAQRALADQLFVTEQAELAGAVPPPVMDGSLPPTANGSALAPAPVVSLAPSALAVAGTPAPGEITISVPLEVTVRLGGLTPEAAVTSAVDPDYAARGGYDPAFLAHPLPLPVPSPELAAAASEELRYHHFSIVMHRQRRLALFTACNIDGKLSRRPRRESDRWIFDPRLPAGEQTGEAVYRDNDLDRGHLVRRLDPAWGTTDAQAIAANDDTFHFTNSTPQHHAFNAGQTLWLGLEDYVLSNADTHNLAVSVFTGPVLAPDDDVYRGVQLPRQFWKIAAMVKESGALSVTGYLLSQAALIDELPTEESFSYGAYRTFQVPVRKIGDLTGLRLDPYIAADPLERMETTPLPRELIRPEDLLL